MDDLEKQYGTSSILRQALCITSNPLVNSNWIYSPEMLNSDRNWWHVIPRDLEIWWMTLENNRAPLLRYFKLCAAFRSHWCIQTGVTVRKGQIWVKLDHFYSRVNLKFKGWPCKSIGHLSYTTSSFVHHFVPIGELKLKLQSRNAWCGSKSTIFLAMWPRNFTDDPKQGKSEGFDSCDRPSNLTQIGFKSSIFQPVWPRNLMDDPPKNRAPLLCYFKLFASFRSHWWIQTGVTVQKRLIWVKNWRFF